MYIMYKYIAYNTKMCVYFVCINFKLYSCVNSNWYSYIYFPYVYTSVCIIVCVCIVVCTCI